VPPTENPDPEIVVPNATAKAMINAPENLSGTNVVIAVADSGVYSDLIFDETAGILSDGTLLALDIVYEGKYADSTLDPIGSRPDVIASILATTELAKTAQIDFLNLSMEYAGTYFNESTDRGTERAVHESTKGGGIGVIVAAGNEGLDYSEIYASNTPACTEAEWDEASVSERTRCYALEFDRKKLDLAIYHNDNLRENYIMVASVQNDRTIAGNSNKPGDHQKIQERFIAAPGVPREDCQATERTNCSEHGHYCK